MGISQDRLKTARQRKKISQKDMGILLGVSQQNYQRWEAKNPSDIKVSNLLKICEILEVTPNYLLGIDGESITINFDKKRK